MAAIILSGGENRRMGRNKAFLTLEGRMFLWRLLGALAPLFREVIVVTREPQRYRGFPVRAVPDRYPERGPLTGLVSGLAATQDPLNFCVGCDMPLVRTSLVQYMVRMAGRADAVIPTMGGRSRDGGPRIEPLHAVYHRRCLPLMERRLLQGRRSLHELVRSLNVRYLSPGELEHLDPGLASFRNINTREAYAALVAEGGAGSATPSRE